MLTPTAPSRTVDVNVNDFQLKLVRWIQLIQIQKFYDYIDSIEIFKTELVPK